MPRELQPCGTYPAYRRHIRNGENPCDLCKQAKRDYNNRRNSTDPNPGTPAGTFDPDDLPTPRDDAIENLRIVTQAMDRAAPNALPALSKRRQELVEYLNALSAKQEGGLNEKLAAARAARAQRDGATDT